MYISSYNRLLTVLSEWSKMELSHQSIKLNRNEIIYKLEFIKKIEKMTAVYSPHPRTEKALPTLTSS